MKLKLDENGQVVVEDGKPVYVHDDGKEIAFDASAAVNKIKEVSDDRDHWRDKAQDGGEELQAYKAVFDSPKEAKSAAELAKDVDRKKLIDAGEMQRVKDEVAASVKESYEEQLQEFKAQLENAEKTNRKLMISDRFKGSKALEGTIFATMPEKAERIFGEFFRVEDGRVVAFDGDRQIYSRKDHGEPADFDEALELLIERDPARDHIKTTTVAKGAGAQNGTPSGPKGVDPSLPPAERLKQLRRMEAGQQ